MPLACPAALPFLLPRPSHCLRILNCSHDKRQGHPPPPSPSPEPSHAHLQASLHSASHVAVAGLHRRHCPPRTKPRSVILALESPEVDLFYAMSSVQQQQQQQPFPSSTDFCPLVAVFIKATSNEARGKLSRTVFLLHLSKPGLQTMMPPLHSISHPLLRPILFVL